MSEAKFETAVTAYQTVVQTVGALKADYLAVVSDIAETEEKLEALPLAYLPFDDVKDGILELVEASGKRYAERHIKAAIRSFATGGMRGLGFDGCSSGKPLRYADIEAAVENKNTSMGRAQLLTPDKSAFDDQVLYYFFGEFVREGLRKIMDDMTPADFGYNTIHPDKIGSGRAERKRAIDDLNSRLKALRERKADIEQKLAAIGAPVPALPKGRAA